MKREVLENHSKKGVERLIEFCMPDLKVVALWPKNMDNGDISVANLRRDFEKLNAERKIYESYDQFIESLKMFLLVDIVEARIFTNFFFQKEVLAATEGTKVELEMVVGHGFVTNAAEIVPPKKRGRPAKPKDTTIDTTPEAKSPLIK